VYARRSFVNAMKKKYHSNIALANAAWGTKSDFKSWEDVKLPIPGQHPGQMWSDALLWYRDSKRYFVRWARWHLSSKTRQICSHYQSPIIADDAGRTSY
jgi:hypothetical protein